MKIWKRGLSVGLSLVMCAGLVAPGFAASFAELQGAINGAGDAAGNQFTAEDGTTRYGYGAKDGETGKYEIEAWDGTRKVLNNEGKETGETADTRHVQLNKEVKRQDNESKNTTITIGNGADVTIDLNGNDIDANKSDKSVIKINAGGTLSLTDSAAYNYTDKEGNKKYQSGAVTGGGGYDVSGGGVRNDGTFIMNGGKITGNAPRGRNGARGGGVSNAGTFTMNDGTITGNTAAMGGGVYNTGTFTMNNGEITNNTGTGIQTGGGVCNYYGTFTMNDGEISGNKASGSSGTGGGVYNLRGTFTMNNGKITNNWATTRGGGVASAGTFTMRENAVIAGNKGYSAGDEISASGTVTLPDDSLWVSDNSNENGRGPYVGQVYSGKDANDRNSNGYEVNLAQHVHKFTKEETTEPTCTEAGQVVHSGCTCGRTVTEEIDPLGHDMGEWYESKKAAIGVAGEERRDCQRVGCDHFETRATDPLPKKPDSGNPTDPTGPTNPTNPTDPTVEVDEPDVPLGELPEGDGDPVEIDGPETPLGELPEGADPADAADPTVEIDDPDVPLGGVPQTGEASAAMWLAVLVACGLGLVYVNTGKRKENA